MPKQPAPCGLRTRHTEHPYGDDGELWCDGELPPVHYDPRHRGRYLAEGGWWPTLLQVFKHRGDGDPDYADEQQHPRTRPRLLWPDRSNDDAREDD